MVSVSAPSEGSRIGNYLHILGTADDDISVDRVEIAVDEGNFQAADGSEFWSVKLDSSSWEDGPHRVRVRAVDADGNESPPAELSVVKDTVKPEVVIDSHSSGSFISGLIELKGSITDLNGVREAYFSDDGGKTQTKLNLFRGSGEGQWMFTRFLDTGKYSDGAFILVIEAVDGFGSSTAESFLFYIDNKAPELQQLYPGEDGSVNGRFTLIGTASDALGISSLSYKADNGTEGELALSPGNPVWVLPLDYSGQNRSQAYIRMVLTDLAGNSTGSDLRIPLDPDEDLPSAGLSVDYNGMVFDEVPVITGMISDDDGPAGRIEYSLNGGDWQDFKSEGPWVLSLDKSTPGSNKLRIRAYDGSGTMGKEESISFVRSSAPAAVIIDSVSAGDETSKWYPGRVLNASNPGRLNGRVVTEAPAVLYWSVNGGERKKLAAGRSVKEGELPFSLSLPKSSGSERVKIVITAVDAAGREFSSSTEYYTRQKPKAEKDQPEPVYRSPDPPDLYITDSGGTGSSFKFQSRQSYISGWVPDGTIASAELSGGRNFLKIDYSDGGFRITASGEGSAESVVLTLRMRDGREYASGPLDITADFSAPTLTAVSPFPGSRAAEELEILAEATDAATGCRLYYSFERNGSFIEIEASDEPSAAAEFSETVSLAGREDGPHALYLRAVDGAGNRMTKVIPFLLDRSAPAVELINPGFSRGSEQVTVSGRVDDMDIIASVDVVFEPPAGQDGEDQLRPRFYKTEINGDIFHLDVNLTELGFEPSFMKILAEDRSGNVLEQSLPMDIRLDMGRPQVQIQVPQEMGVTESSFDMSGLILDREGVKSISFSLNGGPFMDIGSGSIFSKRIRLDELSDDLNELRVKAVDVNGLESETAERNFLVSMSPPEVDISYPELNEVIRGTVKMSGNASDVNGIEEVYVSHDNGSSFQRAEGTEDWTYLLDTSLLKDGISSILVKAVDRAGVSSLVTRLVNIDNSSPELVLTHPAEGEQFRGSLSLSGRAFDSSGISTLNVNIEPLEPQDAGLAEGMKKEIVSRGTILENVDLDGLAAGLYSFRAEAIDQASNRSSVSRVIEILPPDTRAPVLLSPRPGEILGPRFSVQGFLPDRRTTVMILAGSGVFRLADVDEYGYFRIDIGPEDDFPSGKGSLALRIEDEDGKVDSEPVAVEYKPEGVWVTIDNLSLNQYVPDRFMLQGSAGIEDPSREEALPVQNGISLGISLDNGRSFEALPIRDGIWEYKLYSENIPDGPLDILVRAEADGEESFSRCRTVMDTKAPDIFLQFPEENSRFYGFMPLSGWAYDSGGLTDVSLNLRDGSKAEYATPSFIQGMYFDATALGATYFTAGLGLTFMDGNVKLQAQYGYAPPTVTDPETGIERAARFGGNVFGVKLLANLADIPFSWLFGPELSAFSATAALGADFSYFSGSTDISDTSWGIILAGVIAQIELPKITFADNDFLKYLSLFWEGQMWLISSDVSPEVKLLPSVGIRMGLF